MNHSLQRSTDTTNQFLGIIIHDGTNDVHRDVFGGASWENDVWCASLPGGIGGLPAGAALDVKAFVHTFAPHGEAQGPDLSPLNPSVLAPVGVAGNVPLFNAAFNSFPHGSHRDDLLALLLAVANGGRITGYIGIVLAVHSVRDEPLFLASTTLGSKASDSRAHGASAITLDFDQGVLHGAIGILGSRKSELKEVYLKLGPQEIRLPEVQPHFEELDGTGIVGSFEVRVGVDMTERLDQAELAIAAHFNDGTRWECSLVPASTFKVSNGLHVCRPASATATKWGPWKTNEDDAETEAYKKARSAAGRACHGGCTQTGLSCSYTELEAELVDTDVRTTESGQTEYRVRVRSKGKCECQSVVSESH